MIKRRYEEAAYILDFLPEGKMSVRGEFLAEPVAQLLGEEYFTLLEATVKPGVNVQLHERVYIGKEKRDKIDRILGRIRYDELTPTAKGELPAVIEKIVRSHEAKFIEFFNRAQPITPKMHAFELLPGIGKKFMWQIVGEREKKSFENFEDIHRRTLIDPVKAIVKRVIEELSTEQKYRIFTRQA
jgi:putative nucleotide binding protein